MKITFSPNFFINLPFVFSGLSTAADCEHMYSVVACAQGAWTENQKLNVNPKPVNSGKKANGMGDGKEERFFLLLQKEFGKTRHFVQRFFLIVNHLLHLLHFSLFTTSFNVFI